MAIISYMDLGGVRHLVIPDDLAKRPELLNHLTLLVLANEADKDCYMPRELPNTVERVVEEMKAPTGEHSDRKGTWIIQYVGNEPTGFVWFQPHEREDYSVIHHVFVMPNRQSRDSSGKGLFPKLHLGEKLILAAHEHSKAKWGKRYIDGNAMSLAGHEQYGAMRKRHPHIFKPR
jgi:hypothetical protein